MHRALLVALFSAGCAHVPTDSILAGTEYIDAVVTVPERGPARVKVTLPRGFLPPGKTELVAGFPFLAKDFTETFVRELRDGAPRDFRVLRPVEGSEDVVLEYEVRLPVTENMSRGGYAELSFETPRGKHLSLNTLLPRFAVKRGAPLRRPGAVTLNLPRGWAAVSSVPREGERYVTSDWSVLSVNTLDVGALTQATSKLGTQFVSTSFDDAALARLVDLEERAEPRLRALLGSRQRLRVISVHRLPDPVPGALFAGGVHGDASITLRSETRPTLTALSSSSTVLLHELVHAHLPPSADLPSWIVEGVTDYLSAVVALELDGQPRERIRNVVTSAWARLGGRKLEQLKYDHSEVPYAAGTVLGYCLDVRLRRDGSTLAAVLARANVRAGGAVIANDLWEQEIALASAPAGAMLLRSKSEPLAPPDECFAEAGVPRVEAAGPQALGEAMDRFPHLLLMYPANGPFGMQVALDSPIVRVLGRVPTALPRVEPLADGDLVMSLDGRPTDSFDDVVRGVAEHPGDGPFQLKVLHDGEQVDVAIPVQRAKKL